MKMLLQSSTIVLKIHVSHANVTKSVQLDTNCPIYSICDQIRSIIREAEPESGKEGKDYGLFLPHECPKNGIWLDSTKNLAQYILKQGDTLEYKYKYRNLTIQTQDSVRKTLLIDDCWSVTELMFAICAKMGIVNHEEYSLIRPSSSSSQKDSGTNNVGASSTDNNRTKAFPRSTSNDRDSYHGNQRDSCTSNKEASNSGKKKPKTDDDLNWLNPAQTLRQQGIEETEILLLQRKFFFSDMNIDTHDPIQLSLLFIQLKEDILNGKHPVSLEIAEKLAALQCQSEFGDYTNNSISVNKKKLPINVKECLSKEYSKSSGISKKIYKLYTELHGKETDEAKREYCQLCRSLKTYGIHFFLVKEHIKGKSKLVPRLLGVSRDKVVRLDEKTKEILKTWPLTSIKRWAGTHNAFTMDFGDYAPNEYYTAQTNKGEQISQLISGYIDIIMRHRKTDEPLNTDTSEMESSVAEIKVEPNQAAIVELRSVTNVSPRSIEEAMHAKDLHISLVSPQPHTSDDGAGMSHLGTNKRDSSSLCGDFTIVTPIPSETDDNLSTVRKIHNMEAHLLSSGHAGIDEADEMMVMEEDLDTTIAMVTDHYGDDSVDIVTNQDFFDETQHSNQNLNLGYGAQIHDTTGNISYHGTTVTTKSKHTMARVSNGNRSHHKRLRYENNHSPDSFMTGGTIICHTIRKFTEAQQNLIVSIDTNLEKLRLQTQQLDEDVLHTGHQEDTKETQENVRTISKEHAIQDLGSMNTEVIEVLRSTKKQANLLSANQNASNISMDTVSIDKKQDLSALKNIEKSFKIITVHFPSFIENVRTIAAVNNDDDATHANGTVVMDTNTSITNGTAEDFTEIKTSTDENKDTNEMSNNTKSTNNKDLIDAARLLADAFSGMLTAVKPQEETKEMDFRRAILEAANRVGEASSELFRQITVPMVRVGGDGIKSPSNKLSSTSGANQSRLHKLLQNADHDYEDSLIYLVRATANEAAKLVQSTKSLTTNAADNDNPDESLLQRLIGPVTHAGLATSQLVTCVKILAPTINQASCTNQILIEIEDVKDSIDLVESTYHGLLSDLSRNSFELEGYHELEQSGISEALVNVRTGISRLEEHLRGGISVINFAPRIQNLETYLHSYRHMKGVLSAILMSEGSSIDEEDISLLMELAGAVVDDIKGLVMTHDVSNEEGVPQDDVLDANNIAFIGELMQYYRKLKAIMQLDNPSGHNLNQENILEFTFLLDSFTAAILYEPVTKYVGHDQLVHNLYRSSQILITTAHKLIISYRELMTLNHEYKISPECKEVMDNSESLLILMNQVKQDPDNEKILSYFIRQSITLVKVCTSFCSSINEEGGGSHTLIVHTQTSANNNEASMLLDILIGAVSQILAQCEHMDTCLDTIQPIRSHLEMSSVMSMLQTNQLESLSMNNSSSLLSSKLGISQSIQISMAILDKLKTNFFSAQYPHYHAIFEIKYGASPLPSSRNMIGDESSIEPCLLLNLYHNLLKMTQSDSWYPELTNKFKNVIVLLYRLVECADTLLLDHGYNAITNYPIQKSIDELISTLSSLQAKSENIFTRFKTAILNKQSNFKEILIQTQDGSNSWTKDQSNSEFNGTLSTMEQTIYSLHQFKQSLDACSQQYASLPPSQRSLNFTDDISNLYHGYLEVTNFCETTLQQIPANQTFWYRIIEDFILFSLAILNLVQELENCHLSDSLLALNNLTNQNKESQESRINNKTRAVYDASSQLLQSLINAMKQTFGIFSESLLKIQKTRQALSEMGQSNQHSSNWNRKAFNRIICEQEIIKTNSEILKEIIEDRKPISLDNQLFTIVESVCETCLLCYNKFPYFHDRIDLLNQTLDLSIQLINATITLAKYTDESLPASISNEELEENIDMFNNTRQQLEETISYLETRLRQQIPGYQECCNGLTEVTQLSHDLNEVEVSIASERTSSRSQNIQNNTNDVSDQVIKMCTKKLHEIGLSLIQLDRVLSNPTDELTQSSAGVATNLNISTDSMRVVIDQIVSSIDIKKPDQMTNRLANITQYCNQLVDQYDQFLQYLNNAFLKLETDQYVRSNAESKETLNILLEFLKTLNEDYWMDLMKIIESNGNSTLDAANINNCDLANTMSGLITDDDTTILFASAGIKNSAWKKNNKKAGNRSRSEPRFPDESDLIGLLSKEMTNQNGEPTQTTSSLVGGGEVSPDNFRKLIQKTADALLLDTNSLVENSGEHEKSLAKNTESVIRTISGLADDFECGKISTNKALMPETQMREHLNSVNSNLQMFYPRNETSKTRSTSRLTISNSSSLLQQSHKKASSQSSILLPSLHSSAPLNHPTKLTTSMMSHHQESMNHHNQPSRLHSTIPMSQASQMSPVSPTSHDGETMTSCFENMEKLVQEKVQEFTRKFETEKMSHSKASTIDEQMEKVVIQASSVLSLTSELMHMPLVQLLQKQQSNNSSQVSRNISNQCRDTLIEYLDSLISLDESILHITNQNCVEKNLFISYRGIIRQLGENVGLQFIKLFNLLQQIPSNPTNTFSKASLLDIFYMIQDTIKSLLDFSSQMKTTSTKTDSSSNQKSRRVSFRERSQSPLDMYDNKNTLETSINISHTRLYDDTDSQLRIRTQELSSMLEDLMHNNSYRPFITPQNKQIIASIVDYSMQLGRSNSDLIGLCKQLFTNDSSNNLETSNQLITKLSEIFAKLTNQLKSCLFDSNNTVHQHNNSTCFTNLLEYSQLNYEISSKLTQILAKNNKTNENSAIQTTLQATYGNISEIINAIAML